MTPTLTRRASLFALTSALALTAHSAFAQTQASDFGVLVMAHGGGPSWNREVEAMLAPLRNDYRLEIAFGMAEVLSLQEGVRKLEAQGARRIAVIRLFISGESWYERTEQILGIRPGAQPQPAADPHAAHEGHAAHDMALWRIDTKCAFAISTQGLAEAPEIGDVLAERARVLSRNPQNESVLILAHGPGDDGENQRWLTQIDARAEAVRKAAPFKHVQAETLREDWPDKRRGIRSANPRLRRTGEPEWRPRHRDSIPRRWVRSIRGCAARLVLHIR